MIVILIIVFFLAYILIFAFLMVYYKRLAKESTEFLPYGMLTTDTLFSFSWFFILKLAGGSGGVIASTVIFVLKMFCIKLRVTLPWMSNSDRVKSDRRRNIWFYSALLLDLVWFAGLFFRFRLILRGFMFYSLTVLLDLYFMKKNLKVKEFWKWWLLVMGLGGSNLLVCWAVYYVGIYEVHDQMPPILLSHVLPDLVVFALMFFAFYGRFNSKCGYGIKEKSVGDVEAAKDEGSD